MSPTIKITDAGSLIRAVQIGDEKAAVGRIEEVGEEFVNHLKEHMPHVKFDEDVTEEQKEEESKSVSRWAGVGGVSTAEEQTAPAPGEETAEEGSDR